METGWKIPARTQDRKKRLLTIIVPTRNESENILPLVEGVGRALDGVDYRLVFVDDSTDRTPEIIEGLEDRRVSLIHRGTEERGGGLSTAVTRGIEEVSESSEYTCIMDADLQHPPDLIPKMLEAAGEAEVVVASRYTSGGSYAGLSGPARKAVSAASKYSAQLAFSEARKTSDPMSGFFLVKNEAISGIQFAPTGFKILVEVLVCAPHLRVAEVPLRFHARHSGFSKANLKQGLGYLAHLASLFWHVPSAGRFWKFAMVGGSGFLVNMAVLTVLAEAFNVSKVIAWMFAVGISILSNFLLNNAITWSDVRHSSPIHFLTRGALAYPAAIMGIGANFAVYYPLIKYVSSAFPYYLIFNFLGILAATAVNFLLNSHVVFKPAPPKYLDPEASHREVEEELRSELNADRTLLVSSPEEASLSPAERNIVETVLESAQPTLLVNGPRAPQARTNISQTSILAVPRIENGGTEAVILVSRSSVEPFTREDLYWLTAYANPDHHT